MAVGMIVVIALAFFLTLVFLRVPIAISLIGGSIVGITIHSGWDRAASVLASVPMSSVANYSLFVIPMYILMGALIANAGIGVHIYAIAHQLLRRVPGGLPAAAVGATSVFSGISGSSAADIAAFGKISVEEMNRHGYRRSYSAAVIAAAGTFAVLIPPSIVLVIYGILAEVSISAMIVAAILPGILSAGVLVLFVIIREANPRTRQSRTEPALASSSPAGEELTLEPVGAAGGDAGTVATRVAAQPSTLSQKSTAAFFTALIFLIVVGGVYIGLFTATEAGAIGALVALIAAIAYSGFRLRRSGTVLFASLRETSEITSMIFFLVVAGGMFSYFIASIGLARELTGWLAVLNVNPHVIAAAILLALIPVGTVLDGLSTLLLFVPLTVPIIVELGFDPIWWGILMIKVVEIGLITPPVGLNVFVASGVSGTKSEAIYRAVLPFVLLDIAFTAVLFLVPSIALWLPRSAGLM